MASTTTHFVPHPTPGAIPVNRLSSLVPSEAGVAERKHASKVDFKGRRIHFMGAGGIGVSGLMELCAARGAIVSGCDCAENAQVLRLRELGMHVDTEHDARHIEQCDELIYTAAVKPDHPEVQAALCAGKAASVRMHMLGQLAQGVRSICVTGTHGKTSTTWLIAHMLICAGRDPAVLVGGICRELHGNARCGNGPEFVAETDESDNRLDEVIPSLPIVTNIDADHLEHYGGKIERLQSEITRFLASADRHDPQAALIGCGDDERVRDALRAASERSRKPRIEYGFGPGCMIRAVNRRQHGLNWSFDVQGPFGLWSGFTLPMPGEHNVLNALAAISVGWRLGLDPEVIRSALNTIARVGRRFEIKGEVRGVRVIDDYGHHPTEIRCNLAAARGVTQGRLGVLFQPHRYTRTAALLEQFAACLQIADAVFLLPVYAAGEETILGADHHALAQLIRKARFGAVYTFETRMQAVAALQQWARGGDTIVTQGAGDVTRASGELVQGL